MRGSVSASARMEVGRRGGLLCNEGNCHASEEGIRREEEGEEEEKNRRECRYKESKGA